MSRVLEFADEVSGLTPGLDQVQTITNDFTTTANKNSVFFGSITFNATNPVAVVANSELIFHDADVDFKQGFNLQGTLNWITGGGTADKDVSGLQINGTTVIDSARNISNVPLIQATQANIGTNALVVDSSGKVGIGTSSPSQKFHVEDTTESNTSTYIQVVSGNAGNAGIIFGDSDADTRGGLLYNNADDALRFFKSGFTEAMRIDSNGNVGIGITAPDQPLQVKGVIEAQASNSTNGWMMYTYTDNTFRINYNGVGNDEITIDSSGNVGIGATSPSLQIAGAANLVIGTTSDADSGMTFVSTTTGQSLIHFSDANSGNARYDGFIGYEQNDSIMKFGTAQAVRLIINSSGNVGIGTTSPTTGLDMYGAGNIPRIKLRESSGHQLNIGLWDGANYRIEGDSNRPLFITSYHSDGVAIGASGLSSMILFILGGILGTTVLIISLRFHEFHIDEVDLTAE